jgi:hypothetical protein
MLTELLTSSAANSGNKAVRAELARVVERYPAAACHDPTATSRWCETAFAEEGR